MVVKSDDLRDTLAIINCKALKQDHACAAEAMYEKSAQFRAQRALLKAAYPQYAILSAEYGLVWPDQIIEPYDITLYSKKTSRLSASSRVLEDKAAWAQKVSDILKESPFQFFHFHISNAYWAPLEKVLSSNSRHIRQQVNPGLVVLRYQEALQVYESRGVLDFSILEDHRPSKDPEIAKTWYHPVHGTFFGHARDVSKKFGIDEGNLCRVSRGITKQSYGWVVNPVFLPLLAQQANGQWRLLRNPDQEHLEAFATAH